MSWPRYETNTIDDFTFSLEKLALEIAKAAEKNNKKYIIGSGFAIEFFLGRVSRNHHDVDFHPVRSDAEWWIKWFKENGYKVTSKRYKKSGEVYEVKGDKGELLVDIWPLDRQEELKGAKQVIYKGVKVNIEDPRKVLGSKAHHKRKLRPQDLHDFASLGKSPKAK